MRNLFVLSVAVLLLVSVAAVDRNKFKTCSQASFCQRLRAHDQNDAAVVGPARWEVVASSVEVQSATTLVAQLQNTQYPLQPRLRMVRVFVFDVNISTSALLPFF